MFKSNHNVLLDIKSKVKHNAPQTHRVDIETVTAKSSTDGVSAHGWLSVRDGEAQLSHCEVLNWITHRWQAPLLLDLKYREKLVLSTSMSGNHGFMNIMCSTNLQNVSMHKFVDLWVLSFSVKWACFTPLWYCNIYKFKLFYEIFSRVQKWLPVQLQIEVNTILSPIFPSVQRNIICEKLGHYLLNVLLFFAKRQIDISSSE